MSVNLWISHLDENDKNLETIDNEGSRSLIRKLFDKKVKDDPFISKVLSELGDSDGIYLTVSKYRELLEVLLKQKVIFSFALDEEEQFEGLILTWKAELERLADCKRVLIYLA